VSRGVLIVRRSDYEMKRNAEIGLFTKPSSFPNRSKDLIMTEKTTPENASATFDFRLDRSNLFLEETFTDLKTGTVKRFTPVLPDGSADKSRKTLFLGQTSIPTPHGSLPIQNIIPAKDLAQAFKRFPEAMEAAMQQLIEEAKKVKQETASPLIQTPESRIIVP
jgi:hypothetical protein